MGNGTLLICDPHFRACGVCDEAHAVRYVLAHELVCCPRPIDGYSMLIWAVGQGPAPAATSWTPAGAAAGAYQEEKT